MKVTARYDSAAEAEVFALVLWGNAASVLTPDLTQRSVCTLFAFWQSFEAFMRSFECGPWPAKCNQQSYQHTELIQALCRTILLFPFVPPSGTKGLIFTSDEADFYEIGRTCTPYCKVKNLPWCIFLFCLFERFFKKKKIQSLYFLNQRYWFSFTSQICYYFVARFDIPVSNPVFQAGKFQKVLPLFWQSL